MPSLIEPSQVPSSVPLLPLVGTVLFPAGMLPVALGTPQAIAAAEAALSQDGLIVVVTRTAPAKPLEGELLAIGTLAQVLRPQRAQNRLLCHLKGLARVRVVSFVHRTPHLSAQVVSLEDDAGATGQGFEDFRMRAIELLLEDIDSVPFSWVLTIARITEPAHLVDMVAANAPAAVALKQRILEAISVHDRLSIADELLSTTAAARRPHRRLRARIEVALRKLRWRIAVSRGQVPGETIEPHLR